MLGDLAVLAVWAGFFGAAALLAAPLTLALGLLWDWANYRL